MAAGAAERPRIVEDQISYGNERREQMAGYSRRHYGDREYARAITTRSSSTTPPAAATPPRGALSTCNAPNRGELPGVCAHYVVKQSGGIAELVPPRIRCRHAIGLNHRSIGIEMVQEAGPGPAWADRQILERKPQIRAALRLVAWLQDRYGIATADVIGHSMANDSPYFKDLQGWRNDHTDWLKGDVKEFRSACGASDLLGGVAQQVCEPP